MKKILIIVLFLGLTSCSNNTYTKEEVDKLIEEAVNEITKEQDFTSNELENTVTDVVDKSIDSVFIVGTLDREEKVTSTGSGAIFHSDDEYYYGFSNAHVIENGTDFIIQFSDGETYEAEFHGINEETDLAVIKISKEVLPSAKVLKIADYDTLKTGQFVVAIGSPISYTYLNTVTFGVISSTSRRVFVSDTNSDGINDSSMLMIQHDAAINSGNSGGPLLNLKGEVVGINTLKITTSDAQNIGLAISPNYLQKVLFDLVEFKEYKKPTIGVYLQTSLVETEVDDLSGIKVSEIIIGGAAEDSDMKVDDIIVKFNGKTFKNFEELKDFLNFSRIGEVVTFTVVRDSKLVDVEVTLK